MKIFLRVLLGLAGLLILAIVILVGSYYVGYRIAAAPMEELRSSVEVGMSQTEVYKLMAQYDGITDQDSSAMTIQMSQVSANITSPIVGTWFCFSRVQMGEESVESVEEVFCVD